MKLSPWICGLGAIVLTITVVACGGDDDDDTTVIGSSSGAPIDPPGGGSSGAASSSSGGGASSSSGNVVVEDGGTDGAVPDSGSADAGPKVTCLDVQETVEPLEARLGTCEANSDNEEPLAFDETACDQSYATACANDDADVRVYITCLRAVAQCDEEDQDVYDDAIQDCLNAFQNSNATGDCIELVVGD